jgi:hypothetical protein
MSSTNGDTPQSNGAVVPARDEATYNRVLAQLMWDGLDMATRLELILSSPAEAWWEAFALTTLATFRHDPPQWGRIKTQAKAVGIFPPDLERAVDASLGQAPMAAGAGGATSAVPCWEHAMHAPPFIAQPDEVYESLVHDLVFPGAITLLAAPRGTGKSLMAIALAVAAASGGVFRGQQVRPTRVLLVDRDNPPAIVKQRLRGWGAARADQLWVLTRTTAPSLLDRRAWEAFPVDQYDLVIVDSFGAATEGVSEKEGRETQQVLATLKDLAHRGLAVLVLDNTNKAAASYRGRGEKADAVDVLYEVRDLTGWTPPSSGAWWEQLPEAGDHAWAARASRRQGQPRLRLGFIPSKFRFGMDPEPFCLEIDLTQEPWTLGDITLHLAQEGLETARLAQQAQQVQGAQATAALLAAIAQGPGPLLKRDAEHVLMQQGLTQKQARRLLATQDGMAWHLRPLPGKGGPIAVLSVCNASATTQIPAPTLPLEYRPSAPAISVAEQPHGNTNAASENPHHSSVGEPAISVAEPGRGQHKSTPFPASNRAPERQGGFSSLDSLPPQDAGRPSCLQCGGHRWLLGVTTRTCTHCGQREGPG